MAKRSTPKREHTYIDVSSYPLDKDDLAWSENDFFDDDGSAYSDAKEELGRTRSALREARSIARHYFKKVDEPLMFPWLYSENE